MAIFISPGGGTPGGSNTQIQFNDSGAFGGDADLTYNKTTNLLTTKGDINLDDGGSFTTTLQTITPTANRTISYPDATGTLALVAGSSGQLLWNNAGANAGASTLTYDGSILTTSGRFINSYTSLASSPAKHFTGAWFTGGTATTTKPHFLIEPTGTTSTAWSTSGTGLGVNAASGFAGRLLDLQVNGTSRFAVQENGSVNISSSVFFRDLSGGGYDLSLAGQYVLRIRSPECRIRSDMSFGFASGDPTGTALDVALARDAANTLAQRNGGTSSVPVPQVFRVYNYWASATDHERGYLSWSSNVFRVGTEKGSGGGTARALELQTDGITRVQISRDGVYRYVQGAPAAVNTTANLTIANLQGGIITTTTAAAVDMTLPTGTAVEGGFAVNSNDLTFMWSVINSGSNAATILANTDHTIVGAAAVAAGTSGRFATRRTAANTYVTYRLS